MNTNTSTNREVAPAAGYDGTVELRLRGPLPRIGAATVDRLARDADLRAVLFDRARPLAVSRQVNLKDIPAKTRWAVRARDRGCRFPGSPDPAGFTDVDHLRERARGGDHPDTAMVTITRGRRQFHSLPNGSRLAPPPGTCPACATPTPTPTAPDPPGDPPDPTIPF